MYRVSFVLKNLKDGDINHLGLEEVYECLHYLGVENEVVVLILKNYKYGNHSMPELEDIFESYSNHIVVIKVVDGFDIHIDDFAEINAEHLFDNIFVYNRGMGEYFIPYFKASYFSEGLQQEKDYCVECYSNAFKVEDLKQQVEDYRKALLNIALKLE